MLLYALGGSQSPPRLASDRPKDGPFSAFEPPGVVTGLANLSTTAKLRAEMDDAGYLFSGTRGSWSGEDTLRNAAVVLGKSKTAQQLATHALTLDIVNRVLSPYAKKVKLGVATRIVKVAAAG